MLKVSGDRPAWINSELNSQIEAVAQELGAPLARLRVTACTGKKERAAGQVGRLFLMLADDRPGWRAKDENEARRELKLRIAALVPSLSVKIQAAYSCLSMEGGAIVRRDDSGRAIGVYGA